MSMIMAMVTAMVIANGTPQGLQHPPLPPSLPLSQMYALTLFALTFLRRQLATTACSPLWLGSGTDL